MAHIELKTTADIIRRVRKGSSLKIKKIVHHERTRAGHNTLKRAF